MEKIAFVPMHTYRKRRLLNMGIKGENPKHSSDFSAAYLSIFLWTEHTDLIETKYEQLLPWYPQVIWPLTHWQYTQTSVSSSHRTAIILTSVFMTGRKSPRNLHETKKREKEIKCYLKRWFSNKTLINHSSYAPQVCFSIIVLRHNHFRGLERTAISQKGKHKSKATAIRILQFFCQSSINWHHFTVRRN